MKRLLSAVSGLLFWAACTPTPAPVQPVLPTTTTTTTTLPQWRTCPIHLPLDGYRITLRVGHHGDTPQQYDSTPEVRLVKGSTAPFPPVGWVGSCDKDPAGNFTKCDVSPERDILHGADCTYALCGPMPFYELHDIDGQTVIDPSIGTINWQNSYLVKVTVSKPLTLYGQCLIGDGKGQIGVQ